MDKDLLLEKEHLNETIEQYKEVIDDTELSLKSLPALHRGNPELLDTIILSTKTKLNNLKNNINKPYFARIDFEDSNEHLEVCYIGKIGVTDYDNKIITVDWRAPISSLYYDSNIGKTSYQAPNEIITGTLKLKRQYDIENGILNSYTNVDTVANDELLKPYLSVNADNRLKNIVSSIQSEQNSIIRENFGKNLIVQGVAGSGKTTVALHRIAYLAYNNQDRINANQYMVIGPNKFFVNYISSILPDLDVNGVKQLDFIELAQEYINENFIVLNSDEKITNYLENKLDGEIDKFKCSMEMTKLLDNFMDKINYSIIPKEDFCIKNFKILDNSFITKIYKDITLTGNFVDIDSRVDRCILLLTKEIEENYEKLLMKMTKFIHDLSDKATSKSEIDKISKIREEIKKELKNNCKQSLKKYFTNNHLNVINLYKKFISDIDSECKNDSINLKLLKNNTLVLLNKKTVEIEDLPALMYIKFKISGSMEYSNIKQVVVDEAQDYGDFNFYVLKQILNNSYFSIFGDLAQSIYPYKSISNWESVLSYTFENKASILKLEKSYRTTIEIMEEANKITSNLKLNPAIPVIRHGDNVKYINTNDKVNIILKYINEFTEKKYQTIAIISKTLKESNYIYEELVNRQINVTNISNTNTQYLGGICTVPSHLSKGLEFDAVIISNASEDIFDSKNSTDLKLLYVSMTRPLHELVILYDNELNNCLKNRG